jgi:hypothetical protein
MLLAADPATVRHETAAEHLHRRGVHCMEVLERNDCAIDKFEALLDQRTNQRALVTDAMLRLITLYDKEGRDDDIPGVMRRFWDVGRKRGSAGHVPYSTRFLPPRMDVIINIDTPRVVDSGVMKTLGPDVRDLVFSCDEARRDEVRAKYRERRAAKIAKRDGRSPEAVARELERKDAEREAERTATSARNPGPVFLTAACPLARALGQTDLTSWTRMTGAFDHADGKMSAAIAQIPDLAPKLAEAVAHGTITADGADRWTLVGAAYAGAPIHLATLDLDEIVAGPEAVVDSMVTARRKRKRQLDREVDKLVQQVPVDTAFFVVASKSALEDIGFGGGKGGGRVLRALLPRPKGLQIAGVFTDSAALFTRVPTDTPVKAKLLASVANRLMWRAAEDDAEAAAWLAGLDIAESRDRKALLASYIAPPNRLGKIESMIAGD